MKCPKCQGEEINDSGVCRRCGYEMHAETASASPGSGPAVKFRGMDSEDAQITADAEASGLPRYRERPVIAEAAFAHQLPAVDHEKDRQMLLVRAFSGLVDWIVVIFGTGALIMAAEYFSGIRLLDSASVMHYSMLFLLVYFLYSLFFLGLSGQTIGMMLTNLQVVSVGGKGFLKMRRAFARCCAYLLSLFCLGAGLIWAFFDSENRCLHDRCTGTRVVRVYALTPRNSIPNP